MNTLPTQQVAGLRSFKLLLLRSPPHPRSLRLGVQNHTLLSFALDSKLFLSTNPRSLLSWHKAPLFVSVF